MQRTVNVEIKSIETTNFKANSIGIFIIGIIKIEKIIFKHHLSLKRMLYNKNEF